MNKTMIIDLKMRNSPGSRLIHRSEGHIKKTIHEDRQIRILLINVTVTSTNQTRTCEPYVNCSTSTEVLKLQKEVKGQCLFMFNNGESHFLPKMRAS